MAHFFIREKKLSFFVEFPKMGRADLRDFKKGIDESFKDFTREYGEAIEHFFDPLLYFLVWLEMPGVGRNFGFGSKDYWIRFEFSGIKLRELRTEKQIMIGQKLKLKNKSNELS